LAVRASMVAFDLDELESRIAQQQSLCQEIRRLDEQARHLQHQCAARHRSGHAGLTATKSSELEVALFRLYQAQSSVKQLNTTHQALLKRSRRTVAALLNSLQAFEGNYRNVALEQTALVDRHYEA
jgi:uncharacterized protein (DUF3084 family)